MTGRPNHLGASEDLDRTLQDSCYRTGPYPHYTTSLIFLINLYGLTLV